MAAVHRKATHTDKYLSFNSHNPKQHKDTVVKTLFDRADKIPNTIQGKKAEKQNVPKALSVNGYTSAFINSVASNLKIRTNQLLLQSPKVMHVSHMSKAFLRESVNRILTGANIRTAYKPLTTLGGILKKPKDRPSESQVKGIVYKFKCKTCNFLYIGENKRSWKSRWAEHKPETRPQIESAIEEHAERTGHEVCSGDVEILERGVDNYDKRIFLESLHSTKETMAVNERKFSRKLICLCCIPCKFAYAKHL